MDDDDIAEDSPFGEGESTEEETEEQYNRRRDERAAVLGFFPQHEIIYNSLMPYSDRVDDESKEMWNDIKANLGRSVALRELRPGYVMWTGRLAKYVKLYGLKFSKEDHLAVINLLLSVLHIPDLDPWLTNRTACSIRDLLRKRDLLTRDDLQIEWRPLYELYEKLFYSPNEALGLVHYPNPLEGNMRTLIALCRPYFGANVTQEMLEEWRPLMCPFDVTMAKAISYFEMFLPTFNSIDRRDTTFDLWFDELMAFWEACPNLPLFEPSLLTIFTRLADHTSGYLDWSKYIPKFLTRIHHSFDLPVYYKQVSSGKKLTIDINTSVKWIISVMNYNTEIFEKLELMFRSLDSYYQTANFGRHSIKLTEFLHKLVSAFVGKLHRERYRKRRKFWGSRPPPEKMITDEQITALVKTLMPTVLNGMYFKGQIDYFGKILQNLAFLRPELVIPPVMERLFVAFDTLTEPHKLTTSMSSVFSMARSVVDPAAGYKEPPTQVIPLLMSTLPGIDPNDVLKSMKALQLISLYCTLVPFVDCSQAGQYYKDLTEEEELICSQTAQLEDFVVEFLDRCFNFIESSTIEQTRQETSLSEHRNTYEESMKDVGMASTFSTMLIHSSESIYKVALRKVQNFVKGRILETKLSGKIAASLCRCLVKIKPEIGVKVFVPHACDVVDELLTEDMINQEQLIDEELKFNMHILAECVRCRGLHFLPHLDKIKDVLRKSVRMKSKDGQTAASILLRNLLRSLTTVFPQEYRSCPEGYDRPLSEWLPIRSWGKPGNIHNLQMKWSQPSQDELEAAQELIDEFLGKELASIRDFVDGKVELKKDQLQNSLTLISGIIIGAGYQLPKVQAESLVLIDSKVKLDPFTFRVHVDEPSLTFKGTNLRQTVIDVMDKLQDYMLKNHADDHKSLSMLISAYEHSLQSFGLSRIELEHHRNSLNMVKRSLDNHLMGSRKTIRPLLVDRCMIQHEFRVNESAKTTFTATHQKVLLNLLQLATSHYAVVRIRAQETIQHMTTHHAYSYKMLLDPLTQLLSSDNDEDKVSHEAFKGALYTLIGYKDKNMLTKHDWSTLHKVWPSILLSRHSEKPSVAKLLDMLFKHLQKHSETFALENNITEKAEKLAFDLVPAPLKPSNSEISEGISRSEARNADNIQHYENLVDKLCSELETRKLHWRHYNIGLGMLNLLTRHDRPLPTRAVKLMVENLTHENLLVRKCSIHVLGSILKQHKRSHPKYEIETSNEQVKAPGDREENRWLCYDKTKVPKNAEDWDRQRYVHKTHYGYYKWPRKMQVYATSSTQPQLKRSLEEMCTPEQEIFKFFSSEANVTKLIGFLSLEERKGVDHFDARRFLMFKGLFRNYGDSFMHLFRPHLEKLVEQDQESAHRCAAEIIAGVIRGMKHWPWDMTVSFWDWMQPLLRKVVSKITVESFTDWGTCFATASESRDPNRIYWLLEALMEEPIQSKGSFTDCSRLYALQGALAQQEWRIPTIMHQLLQEMKPFMTHSFLNVRERLGSMLTNIFISDLDFSKFPGNDIKDGGNQRNPKVVDFINEILPQIEGLASSEDENGSVNGNGSKEDSPVPMDIENGNAPAKMQLSGALPPEMMMRMPGPRMGMMGPQGPGGFRPPPPEVLMRMMGPQGAMRPPGPELMAQMAAAAGPRGMRMPPPEILARMIPPELANRMAGSTGPPTAEMLAGMIPPEMAANMPGLTGMLPPEIANRMPMPELPGFLANRPPGPGMGDMKMQPPLEMMQTDQIPNGMNGTILDPEKEEKQKAIRLFQAVCKCIGGCLVRDFQGIRAEYYKLLPMLCNHESNEIETHLAKDCIFTLGYIAQAILPLSVIPACLEAIHQVSKSGTWKARTSVLGLLQVTVFLNMPSLLSSVTWVDQVMDVVENSLMDERVEVRSKAGQVLSGLLHCAFVDKPRHDSLLKLFYKKVGIGRGSSKTKKKKKTAEEVVSKHSGILGLCAFVNAFPYDVPDFVPDILMVLSDHLHDPQPIPVTIKKTLQDFKRTHQDNWQEHKLRFSDDQMAVLTDLLVSPSYYA